MKDLNELKASHKGPIVSASILEHFELLRNPKDDTKLTGGAKILASLQGAEVRKIFNCTFDPNL